MTRGSRSVRIGLIALGGVALAVAALLSIEFTMTPRTGSGEWPSQFRSNGERLYFTGVSADGQPMRAIGGDRHMMMMMSGNACVACHGADRQGGRLRPFYWTVAPSITAEALAGEHDDTDDHGHAAYTRESLAEAITSGVRPDGSGLGPRMPQWAMSSEDVSDLVAYLLPDDGG